MFKKSVIAALFTFLLAGSVIAQDALACDVLLGEYFDRLLQSCRTMGNQRDIACYGATSVDATFFDDAYDSTQFDEEGELARVGDLAAISTSGYDAENEAWGLGLMRVQANLPQTLPGQSVLFLLMGDVQVDNAIAPNDATASDATVDVRLQTRTNARYFPRVASGNSIENLGTNRTFVADVLTENESWVRLSRGNRAGWVRLETLDEASQAAVLSLPRIDPESQASFQTFYITTGIGRQDCRQTPSEFVIQTPQDTEVDLRVNDVEMRIGSTIALRTVAEDDGHISMTVTTIDGQAVLFPDTDNAIIVEEGQVLEDCLIYDSEDLADDTQLNNVTLETCETRDFGAAELDLLNVLSEVPDELLNYPPVAESDRQQIVAECPENEAFTGTYSVEEGDSITSIIDQFDLEREAFIEANCLIREGDDAPRALDISEAVRVPAVGGAVTATPESIITSEAGTITPTPTATDDLGVIPTLDTSQATTTPTPTATDPLGVIPTLGTEATRDGNRTLNRPEGIATLISPTPIPEPTSVLPPNCVVRSDWTGRYTVQSGDTAATIATRNNITALDLAIGNCISNPNVLFVGQALRVPVPPTATPFPTLIDPNPEPTVTLTPTPTLTPTTAPVALTATQQSVDATQRSIQATQTTVADPCYIAPQDAVTVRFNNRGQGQATIINTDSCLDTVLTTGSAQSFAVRRGTSFTVSDLRGNRFTQVFSDGASVQVCPLPATNDATVRVENQAQLTIEVWLTDFRCNFVELVNLPPNTSQTIGTSTGRSYQLRRASGSVLQSFIASDGLVVTYP